MSNRLTLAVFSLAALCSAQDPRGRILGRVLDSTGAIIPDVSVTAINIETGVHVSAPANETGNYQLLYLNPGRYHLTAEKTGFKRFERSAVEVRVGDAVTIDILLEPGALTETITVTAETPLLEASEATVGQLVDRRRLQELPLAGGNPLYLLQLTPGIIATNASTHGWFPHALDSISNVAAVGTRTRANQFALDGNPIMTQGGQVSYSPPPEMVQEMRIQTAPFDASLGGFSGANFNIVTKPGTNSLHGDLWFSHYSRPLMTRNFFVNRFIFDPTTGPITEAKKNAQWPPTQTNRYRASASGPLIRNKTFLVYGYDRLFRKRPVTGTSTVPTVTERAGDFSDLLALGARYQIYDPATITPAAGGRTSRQPLAGNIVPASRIDAVAKGLLQFYPLPNAFGNVEGRNNFICPVGTKIDYFSHSARLDHTFSEKHRIFGSLAYSNLDEPSGRRFPGIIAVGQTEDRQHRGLSLDDVYVLSSAVVLNVRYGLTRYLNTVWPDSLGADLAAYGFSSALTKLLEQPLTAIPQIAIQNYQTLSQTSGYKSATNYHTLTGSISHTRGDHTFRYGAEFRVYQENRFDYGSYSPHYDFNAGWAVGPLDNSTAAPIGQGLALFLMGLPTGGYKDINSNYAEQSRYFGFFFQDDWKTTRKLTLNLGLRYELETPTTERYDRTVRGFDTTTPNPVSAAALANYAARPIAELPVSQFQTLGGLLFSNLGGNPRGLWNTDKNNWAPRLGFAWQMTPKTVWRGGYGIYYEQLGAANLDVNQQGFSQRTNLIPSQDNGVTFRANLANPFPDGFLQPAGASAGLLTFVGRSPGFFLPSRRTGYMQRWSLGVQRELPWRILVETSYVGNRGTKLGVSSDLDFVPGKYYSTLPYRDQATINSMTQLVANPFASIAAFAGSSLTAANIGKSQLLKPYPHFSSIPYTGDMGYSWYHSLQMRFDKRFSRGTTVMGSYTWSKFMEAIERLNDFDPRPTEVISPQDRPHHLSVTAIYELPWRNLKGWRGALTGGWQVQAIYQYMTGPPIGFGNIIYYGSDIHDIYLPSGSRSVERWFNTANFERDSTKALAWNVRTFPQRLSGLRSDGFDQWDISAIKSFRVTERVRFQLRAEAQNALNRAMFAAPNTAPANSLFGSISATQFAEARRITVAGKLTF